MSLKLPRMDSKTDAVVSYLRGQIRSGALAPGERLLQELLAERLGVSPTPIREALRRLAAEGLLEYVPYKGVTVRASQDEGELVHICEIRVRTEGYAARLAAENITPQEIDLLRRLHGEMIDLIAEGDLSTFALASEEWHLTINRAARIAVLPELAGRLWGYFPTDTADIIPGRPQATIREHEAVLAALAAGDGEIAERAMAEHIHSATRAVTAFRQADKPS